CTDRRTSGCASGTTRRRSDTAAAGCWPHLARARATVVGDGRPHMTSPSRRKLMLREERSGTNRRNLWAYFGADGALHVDGQDLGPATSPASADGEYEWFTTI